MTTEPQNTPNSRSEEQNMSKQLSKCCQSTFHVVGGDEGTNYYECEKCGKPTDPQPDTSKQEWGYLLERFYFLGWHDGKDMANGDREFFGKREPREFRRDEAIKELEFKIQQVRDKAVAEERARCEQIVANHLLTDWSGEEEVYGQLDEIRSKIKEGK